MIDALVNKMDRVSDLKRQSEQEEALVRSQTMLMLDRNQGKHYITKRVIKRFLGCIRHQKVVYSDMLSDKDKLNFEYMGMGILIGVGIGYIIGMYIIYLQYMGKWDKKEKKSFSKQEEYWEYFKIVIMCGIALLYMWVLYF